MSASLLPDDTWKLTSDFLQSPLLSHVCFALWTTLRGRHVRLRLHRDATEPLSRLRTTAIPAHTAVIDCLDLDELTLGALNGLQYSAPALTALTLTLASPDSPPSPALPSGQTRPALLRTALAGLKRLRSLTVTLHPDLGGEYGAAVLLAVAELPALRAVALRCGHCDAEGLQGLQQAERLTSVLVQVDHGDLREAGLKALATVGLCRSLQRLSLALQWNHINRRGTQELGCLGQATELRQLHLDVSHNPVGDRGLDAVIAPLCGSHPPTNLQHLALELRGADLGPQAGVILASLAKLKHLHTLALDLQDNVLGDPGVAALAALSRCPALASLSLDVMNNELGDDGTSALGAYRRMPNLTRLAINLSFNRIGDAGARALITLLEAPRLEALQLDVAHNHLSHNAAGCLAALALSTPAFHVHL